MRVTVNFGNETMELDVANECVMALKGGEPGDPIGDLSGAVAHAIESPHEFPPLRRAVVPGDHVAIVLDEDVPRPADVLGPVVECLLAAGVAAYDIHVV